MSATNRGGERLLDDGYNTPVPLARAICSMLLADGHAKPDADVLEPSVGGGAFAYAVDAIMDPNVLDMVDFKIREGIHMLEGDTFEQDFLTFGGGKARQRYDLVIGNPPYEHAEEHVRHALTLLKPDGTLAFLLRVNFLAGIDRHKGLWKECPPSYVYVLDKRPSFGNSFKCKPCNEKSFEPKTVERRDCPSCGKPMKKTTSDSTEYGLYVWRRGLDSEPVIRFMSWKTESKRATEWEQAAFG